MTLHNALTNEPLQSSPALSPEIIAYFDKQLTKPRLRILEVLTEHECLHQKELSDAIGTSKNNLSNLLSKLDQLQPKLINVDISGRTRTYSLTDEAKAYMAQKNSTNIRFFKDINGPEYIYKQAMDSLEKFKKLSPSDWEVSFNKILIGDLSFDFADQLTPAYNEFMNQMISLALAGQTDALNQVYHRLDNVILINGIKDNIDAVLGKHHCRLPLYQLEKQDSIQAQALINEIITELYPYVRLKTSAVSSKISDAQYHALFYSVVQMRNEFLECGTREEALKRWESPYIHESSILGYLASIFELISQISRKTNL